MLGTQISMMVFPLIPPAIKSALPHSVEVEFVHSHNLGNFNFVVQKSPSGFNVTIRPLMNSSDGSVQVPKALPQVEPVPSWSWQRRSHRTLRLHRRLQPSRMI